MGEVVLELTVAFDADEVARCFPEIPGVMADQAVESDAPESSTGQLVAYLDRWIRSSLSESPTAVRCGVDVLTVDHRARPPKSTPEDVDPDAF